MNIGAQRHANCSNQGFKCLQRIYHKINSQLISLNFKAGCSSWHFISYISYFLHAWFVHIAHTSFFSTQKQY